jgi:IS30 family transposase
MGGCIASALTGGSAVEVVEREEISRGVAAGQSCRQIAARLGRAPSTVSRELASNGGRARYRAQAADAAAFRRAQRPKPAKLALEPRLRAVVEAKLALRWSPEQIAGWLPLAYPGDAVMRVSHETIYLSLFVQHVTERFSAARSPGRFVGGSARRSATADDSFVMRAARVPVRLHRVVADHYIAVTSLLGLQPAT